MDPVSSLLCCLFQPRWLHWPSQQWLLAGPGWNGWLVVDGRRRGAHRTERRAISWRRYQSWKNEAECARRAAPVLQQFTTASFWFGLLPFGEPAWRNKCSHCLEKQKHLCKHTGMANVPNTGLSFSGWVSAWGCTCLSLLQLHSSYFTHQTTASASVFSQTSVFSDHYNTASRPWWFMAERGWNTTRCLDQKTTCSSTQSCPAFSQGVVGHHGSLMVPIILNTQSSAKQPLRQPAS